MALAASSVLMEDERARLLASYTPHAARPVLLLAYQGMRTGGTLRLDWWDVDLRRQSLRVRAEDTKGGRGRALPMHPRASAMLAELHGERGKSQAATVFLSARCAVLGPARDRRRQPACASARNGLSARGR